MKTIVILLFLIQGNQGSPYISMDHDSLNEDEVPTLIYTLGCGNWSNFTFTVTGNQITASANVPASWLSCSVDPAPQQFWNRIPLTQLPAGHYDLILTLNGPTQTINNALSFIVAGGTQPQTVPINNLTALLMLALLVLLTAAIRPR